MHYPWTVKDTWAKRDKGCSFSCSYGGVHLDCLMLHGPCMETLQVYCNLVSRDNTLSCVGAVADWVFPRRGFFVVFIWYYLMVYLLCFCILGSDNFFTSVSLMQKWYVLLQFALKNWVIHL